MFKFYFSKKVLRILAIVFVSISIPLGLYLFNSKYKLSEPKADDDGKTSFYVSPNGNDTNPGTLSLPFKTIEKARDMVRNYNQSMTSNIYVYIRDGEYLLSSPINFTVNDSGKNGYKVIYTNYKDEKPIISGGTDVKNWQQEGNKWKTYIGTNYNFRQIYVNGVRAIRARSVGGLEGQSLSPNGFYTSNTSIGGWKNIKNVEVVSNNTWKQLRCPIDSVSGNNVILQSPCFPNSQLHPPFNLAKVDYLENAFELLDAPREWYYDKTTGYLYYIPSSSENMASARVIIPTNEKLITGYGNSNAPIENISFQGLIFAYTSWARPSNNSGWVEVQANFVQQDTIQTKFREISVKPASAIDFIYAKNLNFSKNTFVHLGSAGINLGNGSQNNIIDGNDFWDISSNGIMLGDVDNPNTTDTKIFTKSNTISNNTIRKIGEEFKGAVAIFLGYTIDSKVANNTIFDIPYTGISIGWGWGEQDPTFAKNNIVESNLIFNHMQELTDGGGIYSLSAQPGNIYRKNVILNQKNEYGGLYLDNSSRFISLNDNVLFNNKRSLILHLSGDNTLNNNYWQNRYTNDVWDWPKDGVGPNIFTNNHEITSLSQVPSEMLTSAGAAPTIMTDPSSVKSGDNTLSWKVQPTAIKYLIRIDDLSDPWSCSTTSTDGDVCTESTSPNFNYKFKSGHSYKFWVHAVNSATNTYGPGQGLDISVASTQALPPSPSPSALPSPSLTPTIAPQSQVVQNLLPSGETSPVSQNISWSPVPGAIKYYLRVDDLSDPFVCSSSITANGDLCTSTTSTSFNYIFKLGHTYNIWVHAVYNSDGTNYSIPTSNIVKVVIKAPINLIPSGSITAGTQNISWSPVPGAIKYYLRVDDLSDPFVCNGVTANGDVCIDQASSSYSYNFKSGHKYKIWVHSIYDTSGKIYSNDAVGVDIQVN